MLTVTNAICFFKTVESVLQNLSTPTVCEYACLYLLYVFCVCAFCAQPWCVNLTFCVFSMCVLCTLRVCVFVPHGGMCAFKIIVFLVFPVVCLHVFFCFLSVP